jgi:hypothetical protein
LQGGNSLTYQTSLSGPRGGQFGSPHARDILILLAGTFYGRKESGRQKRIFFANISHPLFSIIRLKKELINTADGHDGMTDCGQKFRSFRASFSRFSEVCCRKCEKGHH